MGEYLSAELSTFRLRVVIADASTMHFTAMCDLSVWSVCNCMTQEKLYSKTGHQDYDSSPLVDAAGLLWSQDWTAQPGSGPPSAPGSGSYYAAFPVPSAKGQLVCILFHSLQAAVPELKPAPWTAPAGSEGLSALQPDSWPPSPPSLVGCGADKDK